MVTALHEVTLASKQTRLAKVVLAKHFDLEGRGPAHIGWAARQLVLKLFVKDGIQVAALGGCAAKLL